MCEISWKQTLSNFFKCKWILEQDPRSNTTFCDSFLPRHHGQDTPYRSDRGQQSHRAATRASFALAGNNLFWTKMKAAVHGSVPVPCCASHPVKSRKTAKQPGLYRWRVSLGSLSHNKQFLAVQHLSCKSTAPSLGFRRRGTLISCSASPKVQV